MMRISETVKHLIIINVIIFIGTLTVGEGILFYDLFAMHFPKNEAFQPWQIITHMFMHGGFEHLLFNMLLLFFVGSGLEFAIGRNKFLFLYISAGLGALILQLGEHYLRYHLMETQALSLGATPEQIIKIFKEDKVFVDIGPKFNQIYNGITLGASGAIMGVFAAYAFLFPNREVYLLFPPIPIKIKYLAIGMIGGDFLSALLTGTPLLANSNVGYFAHVGGALTGFLIMWYWKKTQFNRNRWN
ncbi:rhomboid family intramembrane serine protease [Flavivirga aquimarina]|uniref:Rhomboid family intramembrane serine protease n=1 Tax=Flavivirga aquimarina TaxID=2027862 RepID=A0ABT8WEX2_9FLAO|nr:rhomboid family intramembrane serine protease [Flavivirga aquimarina]MDO5971685.1 rhomboid family intramembrane serine protease [Flavivirga aquimarina]